LQATGGHSLQFGCDWWPIWLQEKRCLKGRLYILIIFCIINKPLHASKNLAYGPWTFDLQNVLVLLMT
jgi:hypothetical protein